MVLGRHAALLLTSGILLAQNAAGPVIRIEVNLVQIDAVVTDSKNQPVSDLTAADFEIRQDGKLQKISNFAYIGPAAAGLLASRPAQTKGAPPTPPEALKPTDVRRTFALVVDDLGISAESIPLIRRALSRFVDQDMQPGDLVALVPTSGGSGIFQQFTSDPRLLHAAIDRLRFNFVFSRVGLESIPSLDPRATPPNFLKFQISQNATMRALRAVLRGLRGLPGRKVMLLVSEDLSMLWSDQAPRIGDMANRASVVIDALDPRGLPTLSLTAADDVTGLSPAALARIPITRMTAYGRSQSGMIYLANQTGGLFFRNDNDLGGALHQLSEDAAAYYLIGYHPGTSTWEAKNRRPVFHKLEIRVKRRGLHVRSRTGFFGTPETEPDPSRVPLRLRTRQGQIQNAFESPFTADAIHVHMAALPQSDNAGGWEIHGLLHIDARDVQFAALPDGRHEAGFEVVTMVAGDNLPEPEYQAQTATLRIPSRNLDNAVKSGIFYEVHRPVAKPGAYQFKVVVRDNHSGQVGTASQFVEVPDLAKGDLTLSGIALHGEAATQDAPGPPVQMLATDYDPEANPAVRSFERGRAILLEYQILNARADARSRPDLVVALHVFRGRQEVFSPAAQAFDSAGHTDPKRLVARSTLELGPEVEPGEYTLEVRVTDELAPAKAATASQYTDFAIRP